MRNLVSNAIKFTSKEGNVHISAFAKTDREVQISIQDTGIGMDREMIDNFGKGSTFYFSLPSFPNNFKYKPSK